ncbi:MAG: cyanophycin synthetase [Clostridium sp.]|jgi:cyanophycin synthetase|uniref:cyanophycin synthetase n=1 Tax=Clostridium sp. TaxID=1506 RepID=UPI0025BB1C07|nr:cyanophycin synthetase [Clostridium sp.]MCH3965319.1 cyanophycin synthetase [Clostridium sp.]MCI1714540.1 cyanophycin synthetase [Clostridium sp.]MCI1798802.1 cyanophycin synthetase [Clostridium sp.]MCI1812467.1 cyanophycin synthetase [Clostridium sp.]MCI1869612.1 cyanophycin synthetase [Clostridium sp.]
MKIDDIKVFEGRNIYSHKKCIKMCVDLEGYSEVPTKDIKNFNDNLLKTIPELNEHRCGIDKEHGFVKRLHEGTYLAHVCEHIIIAIQNMLGIDVCYGKSRETQGDKYYIVFQYIYKNTGVQSARTAVDIINSFINHTEYDFEKSISALKDILREEEIGPSTASIIQEAKRRKIPVTRIGDNSVFQLGYGKYSKIIEATISSNTKAVAVDIACDKLLTKEILRNQCLPVADGDSVKNMDDLIEKAEQIGYPVVLKPRRGNQGRGVFPNLKNKEEAMEAYKLLCDNFSDIIIEKNISGKDYRICIVNGKVVAVSKRIAPYVIGDGASSIRKLIENVNMDVMRGYGHEKPLTKIKIDEELKTYIGKKNYDLNSILKKGEKLILRENSNLSTGGKASDCTDMICSENIDICERAAQAIGLDICGIDLCCKDIGKSALKDGAILEINAAPGIRMHQYPSKGKARNVSKAIVDELFKNSPITIPIVSITGTNGKTTTTRLLSHILGVAGYRVGMTTTGGIYIGGKCIYTGDTTGYYSAKAVLNNHEVEAAVLETARGGIIKKGLAYDKADVGVITNITEDHLGIDGIETMEDLAFVKSLVGEAVKDDGYVVLNADDLVSMSILNRIKARIIMFSRDKYNTMLRNNINKGAPGIYIYDGVMYFEREDTVVPIVKVSDIKISIGGKLMYNVENAMASCAAALALNISYADIGSGLKTFYGDAISNPGRFNIYELNNAKVILDYGHNIEGYKSVIKGIKNITHERLVGIIGVPGDRTDKSIEEIGRIAGENFDYIYIKEDKDRRGRKLGDVAAILKRGVLKTGFNVKKVRTVLDEKMAFEEALDSLKSNDVMIIFFENLKPLQKVIDKKIAEQNVKKVETSKAMV